MRVRLLRVVGDPDEGCWFEKSDRSGSPNLPKDASATSSPNAYRVRPVGDLSDSGLVPGGAIPKFEAANPRPTDVPDFGGSGQIASFNVLNCFVSIDDGVDECGPARFPQDCRGADSEFELDRQSVGLGDRATSRLAGVCGSEEMLDSHKNFEILLQLAPHLFLESALMTPSQRVLRPRQESNLRHRV